MNSKTLVDKLFNEGATSAAVFGRRYSDEMDIERAAGRQPSVGSKSQGFKLLRANELSPSRQKNGRDFDKDLKKHVKRIGRGPKEIQGGFAADADSPTEKQRNWNGYRSAKDSSHDRFNKSGK